MARPTFALTPRTRTRLVRAATAALLGLVLAVAGGGGDAGAEETPGEGGGAFAPSAVSDARAPRPQDVDGLDFTLPNGSFETGDFNTGAWKVNDPGSPFLPNPPAANVEVVSAFDIVDAGMNPAAAPTDGGFMALLCNGPDDVTAVEQGNLDGDSNPENDNDRAVLEQSFTLTPADVPATLSFDWNWMTSESPVPTDPFDDFFQVSLNGNVVLSGSRDGGGPSPYADVPTDQVPLMVMSNGTANDCRFTRGQSGWNRFVTILTTPQTYNLAFVVADQGTGDYRIDSGLLVDNIRIEPEVDLALTKSADPEPAFAGESLVYTLAVENRGTGVAMDVVLTDTLPAGVTYVSDTGACDNANANTAFTPSLTCDLGDLRGGEVAEVRVKVDLAPGIVADKLAAGEDLVLRNRAGVTSLSPDRDPTNNAVDLRTLLMDRADLKITKLGLPLDTVRAGDPFSYTLYVDNLGPSDARNVMIIDNITSLGAVTGLQVVDDPNRLFDACTIVDTDLACRLGEPLEPQSEGPLNGRWEIQIRGTAQDEQDINNVARVLSEDPQGPEGETPDPDPSNNMAMDSLTVVGMADLEVKKIGFALDDDSITVRAGRSVYYDVTVINHGPSVAEGVRAFDNLPPAFVEGSFVGRATLPGGDSTLCVVGTAGDPLDPMVCDLGNLAPGEEAVIRIIGDIDPDFLIDQPNTDFAGLLANEAYARSDVFDPDSSNDRSYEINIEVIGEADLAVTKSAAPDPVRAGELLDYVIGVTNLGPSSAERVVISDTLPAGVTFVSAQVLGARGSCVHDAGLRSLDCDLGDMVPEEDRQINVLVRVNEDTPDGALLANTAARNGRLTVTPDPNPANDGQTVRTLVQSEADLGIQKSVADLTPTAGGLLTYEITVTNFGPAEARNVVVTDTLPAGVTWLVDTIGCGPPNAQNQLVCDLGDMPSAGPRPTISQVPGSVRSFQVRVRVKPETVCGDDTPNPIRNEVVVAADNADPRVDNNRAIQDVSVQCASDLRILKFGKRDGQVRAGDLLTYTLFIDNLGTSWAKGVALKDILQSSGVYDLVDVRSDRPASCTTLANGMTSPFALPASPWPIADAPPPFGVDNTAGGVEDIDQRLELDCILDAPLPVLAADGPPNTGRWILTMRVRAAQEQDVNNTAWALSDSEDPATENNEAFVQHEITDVGDLVVTKVGAGQIVTDGCPPGRAVAADRATAGLSTVYTMTVTNAGPSDAENVVLVDRLPPGIVVTDYRASQGDCETGTPGSPADRFTCGLGLLRTGESATVVVTADVAPDLPDGTVLENDVFVSSDVFDDFNGNNYASHLATVEASADLAIQKDIDPASLSAGEALRINLVVDNLGPSDARQVSVRDVLHPDFLFQTAGALPGSATGAACDFDPVSRAVTCGLGTLPAGARTSLFIDVIVDPDAVPPGQTQVLIGNLATVRSVTSDPCRTNNTDDDMVTVLTVADLRIDKSAFQANPAVLGQGTGNTPLNPAAGTRMTYRIALRNEGPSDAHNVEVTDQLPPGFRYLGSSDTCAELPPGSGSLSCRPAGTAPDWILPAGDAVSFDVLVEIEEDVPPDEVTNTACATADNGLVPQVCDDTTVRVDRISDLRIRKYGKPDDAVRAGQLLTYTLLVDNLGPSETGPVFVTDTMVSDDPFELVSIRPVTGGEPVAATCRYEVLDPLSFAVLDSGTVQAGGDLPGPVAVPEMIMISCSTPSLSVFGPADPGKGRWALSYTLTSDIGMQFVNNVSSVSGPDPDPDFGNNESAVRHEITRVADLEVDKSSVGDVIQPGPDNCDGTTLPTPGEVTAGETLTYTIKVTNFGPSMAENTKLLDRLPPYLTVTAYDIRDAAGAPRPGNCSTGESGNPADRLMCGLADMEPGEMLFVTVVAEVDAAAPEGTILENDVAVFSDVFDDNNGNDFDSELTEVSAWADLKIAKAHAPEPVTAGEPLRYEIEVRNEGPSDAQNVVMTDVLPDEVVFLAAGARPASAIGASCAYDPIAHELACNLGTMPAGSTALLYIDVLVKPDAVPSGLAAGTITNQARVASDTADPCDDNEVVDVANVERRSSVYVRKSDAPDPVLAGTELVYTLTFGNDGPSTATNVVVSDLIPEGLAFQRCESAEPADQVRCAGGPEVFLEQILQDGTLVWQDTLATALNDLDPGEEYRFRIVALVESGYVLDGRGDTGPGEACEALKDATGWAAFAHNRASVVAETSQYAYSECTRVDGEADLAVDLTDVPTTIPLQEQGGAAGAPPAGDEPVLDGASEERLAVSVAPLQAPNNDFLMCDPIEPGQMLTYRVEVRNLGPSDAAQVVAMVWLPEGFVAVDPAVVDIDVVLGEALVEEVRDDGKVTLVIGNDPDNQGQGQLGRLNAGNRVVVDIGVMVRLEAECGGTAEARAQVMTRRNDLLWPPVNGARIPRTPTPDRNLANSIDRETTRIECPSIEIDKTVSYDGTCPGADITTVNVTGQPVTFCFEITNTGTTYLDDIRVTDTLRTRSMPMPMIVYTDTITHGVDPKVPVAPGEVVTRQVTIDALTKQCGTVTDRVEVTANPVNSGRTDLPCMDLVSDFDEAVIEVPCAGVDWRLQLPIVGGEGCETLIQVQNVGDADSKAMVVFWGEPGACPPQSAGPLKLECTGLLAPGSAWTMTAGSSQLPLGANSAVVYSLNAQDLVPSPRGNPRPFADVACGELFNLIVGSHDLWAEFDYAYRTRGLFYGPYDQSGQNRLELDFGAHSGEPLAVSVNRTCPDPVDPNITVSAAYTGVSSDLEGARDPRYSGYTFYAPLVFADKAGLNSTIRLHNSGDECTSLELWLLAQDNCLRPSLATVLSLAPGETHSFDPNTVVGPDWLGSAWIRASQPMGIVVDTFGANHFTSYTGMPADIYDLEFSLGSQVSFAPLVYSEYQGWDSALQVQNLSAIHAAKVKVYFLDRSGDIITTLVDWICPRGSQTYYLPVIENIPGSWVGSARAESQEWWAPGQPLVDPPRIQSVVLLERWADPARTSRREAVAYNGRSECLLYDWQIASGGKGGTASGSAVFAIPLIAKGFEGITSEIGITNLVPKPGFTDFVMIFYDQNGLVDQVCQKLNEKQVEYIDLNSWGAVPRGFLGSLVVSAVFWEHDVFDGSGEFERNLVGLGGVAVERIGGTLGGPDVPGDESKAFEAFPVFDFFDSGDVISCPGVR